VDRSVTRTTVVAGVGPGLGSSVARAFAEAGDAVALLARSGEYLEEVAAGLETAMAVPTDVSDPDAVAAAFDRIREEFGPVDAYVDCVYSTRTESGGIREVGREAFEGAWTVETAGAFHCAREAVADMEARGTVVFTSSTASRRGDPDGIARSSARFALRGMAESMARDLDRVQVVHAVIDGWIDKPALRERAPDRPDDRWIDPDGVALEYRRIVDRADELHTFEVDFRAPADGGGV
jgi:NAD(P)-dependent dehydrogenase (short-subunit alcohol dehydrogenase family)